jgi:C-terminal processing protease CtpA/Prc
MINLDMIGRFEKDKNVLIYGVGTSPQWIQDIEAVHPSFPVKYDSAGIGPSDQTSFYLMNIPVLHFFTGQHSDYHKPTDDFNKINAVGETNILEMIIDLVYHMDGKDKLSFLKTKDTESRKTSFKVTMGVMPDYVFDGIGMRIDGVTDGKPAAKAGLEQGDIILQIGDSEVSDVQGYMKILNTLNKGDLKKVIIERKGTRLEKEVQF